LAWLALFGVYAAALGIDAFSSSDYGGDEPHHLLSAESIVSDGDLDLTDEYATRAYADWYPYALEPRGRLTDGRRNEPHGAGFGLLIAPAYALGGPLAVELFLAALAALAFLLAAALARRLVPHPWATVAPALVALSPPALAYSTAVYPELPAGALLAGAALLALRVRARPAVRPALLCAALLAALPWLEVAYLLPAAVVATMLVRWLVFRRRRVTALVAAEVVFASLVAFVSVNGRLYGGLTPHAAELPSRGATGASSLGDYLERTYRLVALWIDRDYGLLRWAPVVALAFLAVWLLWRSRRERLARALPAIEEIEAAAGLLAAICAAQLLLATFLAPTMFGFWFPGRHLIAALPAAAALAAWGLRHAPRAGAALGALTLLASAWLYLALRLGEYGWVSPLPDAPLGPLVDALPSYDDGAAWPFVLAGAVGAVLALLAAREWWRWRQSNHMHHM